MNDSDLINELVEELKPVRQSPSTKKLFAVWVVCNFVFLTLAIGFSGSLREGWQSDLFLNFRFLLEFVIGIAVSTVSGYYLFQHAVPGNNSNSALIKWTPVILLVVFTIILTASVFLPAKLPGEVGHRYGCLWQMLGFSIPPLLVLLYHLGKSAPVNIVYVGFLAGLAASAPFATAMHLACMYDPRHILVFHIFPVIAFSLLTAILARFFIRWWRP